MTHEITLHFRGYTDAGNRSDKVYVVTVERHDDRFWAVHAQWGRRGGTLRKQHKGLFASHWAAVNAFNSLVGEKMDKGYQVAGRSGSFRGDSAISS